jgi:hypothetical protein
MEINLVNYPALRTGMKALLIFDKKEYMLYDPPVFLTVTLHFYYSLRYKGIVFSNDLLWFYFFRGITTICSFALIGYRGLLRHIPAQQRAPPLPPLPHDARSNRRGGGTGRSPGLQGPGPAIRSGLLSHG